MHLISHYQKHPTHLLIRMAAPTLTTDGPRLGQQEMKKMSPSFHPTLWGDFFLSYEAPTEAQVILVQHA
jgi:hypothetical protein